MSKTSRRDVTSPPERVRVSAANGYSGDRRYHTTEACRYAHDGMQEWDREMAEAWEIAECLRCRRHRGAEVDEDV